MPSEWFKNDWTLAHFLYYITQIGALLLGLNIIVMSIMFFVLLDEGQPGTYQIPVRVSLEQFEDYNDFQLENIDVHISEYLEGKISITTADDASSWPVIWFYLLKISKSVILIAVLFFFNKILKTVIDEEPFHEKNPTYLYAIGWILILTPILLMICNLFAQSYFEQLSFPQGFKITSLDLYGDSYIIAGIGMIVLGYVFKEGIRLHDEQKLTV